MQAFQKIDGSVAIVRLKGGLQKQVEMFHRNGAVFLSLGGGFLRIVAPFDGIYGTVKPDVSVLEFDAPGVEREKGRAPLYKGVSA